MLKWNKVNNHYLCPDPVIRIIVNDHKSYCYIILEVWDGQWRQVHKTYAGAYHGDRKAYEKKVEGAVQRMQTYANGLYGMVSHEA